MIASNSPTRNAGNGINQMVMAGWTVGGSNVALRSLLKFDLSGIPASATIATAKLSLYANTAPNNGNLIDAHFGTTNQFVLERVTANWSSTVTLEYTASIYYHKSSNSATKY